MNKNNEPTELFCGNDVASERAMVRRFIKHSVKQWVNLYGFDGFRFDLMGILDIQTMNRASRRAKSELPKYLSLRRRLENGDWVDSRAPSTPV